MDNWYEVIDKIEYYKNYEIYDYEEEERPSDKTIFNVCKLILKISEGPPPMRIVPCGDNGLAFEWASGDLFETINVIEDKIDHILFRDCKIIDRYDLVI